MLTWEEILLLFISTLLHHFLSSLLTHSIIQRKVEASEITHAKWQVCYNLKNVLIRWIIMQLSAIFSLLSGVIKYCLFGWAGWVVFHSSDFDILKRKIIQSWTTRFGVQWIWSSALLILAKQRIKTAISSDSGMFSLFFDSFLTNDLFFKMKTDFHVDLG